MRTVAIAVVVGLIAIARAAPAQNCGAVTERGECSGTTLSYCDPGTNMLETYDCKQRYTATSSCADIGTRFRCVEAEGQSCIFDDNGTRVTLFCAGPGAGCLERNYEAKCSPNLGACTGADALTCGANDQLTTICMEGQRYVIDCGSYDGVCSNQACRQIPPGKPCDGNLLFCSPELQCVLGVCIPRGFDGGTVPRDARASDPDAGAALDATAADAGAAEESSCGCTGARAKGSDLGIIVFVILLSRKRWIFAS